MKRTAIIIALTALAGCTAGRYVNPGVSDAQAQRDSAQCKYEAKLATVAYGTGSTRYGVSGAAGQGVAEGIAQASDQRDLWISCMEARGYQRER